MSCGDVHIERLPLPTRRNSGGEKNEWTLSFHSVHVPSRYPPLIHHRVSTCWTSTRTVASGWCRPNPDGSSPTCSGHTVVTQWLHSGYPTVTQWLHNVFTVVTQWLNLPSHPRLHTGTLPLTLYWSPYCVTVCLVRTWIATRPCFTAAHDSCHAERRSTIAPQATPQATLHPRFQRPDWSFPRSRAVGKRIRMSTLALEESFREKHETAS